MLIVMNDEERARTSEDPPASQAKAWPYAPRLHVINYRILESRRLFSLTVRIVKGGTSQISTRRTSCVSVSNGTEECIPCEGFESLSVGQEPMCYPVPMVM